MSSPDRGGTVSPPMRCVARKASGSFMPDNAARTSSTRDRPTVYSEESELDQTLGLSLLARGESLRQEVLQAGTPRRRAPPCGGNDELVVLKYCARSTHKTSSKRRPS